MEEEKILDVLLELVHAGKMIFLVLNCKNRFDPIDLARVKDELRERIQLKAGTRQLLDHIPIVEVNARSALKAKLENKQNLLNSSGFPKFESALAEFFASVEQKAIVARVATELRSFIQETVDALDGTAGPRLDLASGQLLRRYRASRTRHPSWLEIANRSQGGLYQQEHNQCTAPEQRGRSSQDRAAHRPG